MTLLENAKETAHGYETEGDAAPGPARIIMTLDMALKKACQDCMVMVLIRILSQMWEYMRGHTLGSGPEETQDSTWRKSWLKRKWHLVHIECNIVWAAQIGTHAMRRTKFRLRLIATLGKYARLRRSRGMNAQVVSSSFRS